MKGKIINFILILMLLAGLSLLLYPAVSDYVNSLHQAKLINQYTQQVEQMEEYEYQTQWDEAVAYNKALLDRTTMTAIDEETREIYYTTLNTSTQKLMGYVEIPSIGVTLPIAHGTEERTLQKYVGHLEWSSLPVGGESTHCVISGHRGLPSAELFTNIDHLEIDDVFYIHVLGRKLEYIVDNIAVVEPYDYSLLTIEEGKDYTTLVTCTPYGINSHRLLVRGSRVETRENQSGEPLQVKNEVSQVDMMLVIPVILAFLVIVVFIVLIVDSGKKKRKGRGEKHEKT